MPRVRGQFTNKERMFIQEYLVDMNATEAAKRAGYSKRSALWIGPKMLKTKRIADAVQKAMDKRAARLELTTERVLLELARIAFFDPRRLFNDDGTPKEVSELDDDCVAAIAGIEVAESSDRSDGHVITKTKKYRLADKNSAITNALRHLGLLHDRIDLTSKGKSLAPDFSKLNAKEQLQAHALLRKAKAAADGD